MSRKLTLSEFIEKAKFVHGDKYDYSKSVYENTMKKIMIICPIHGEFMQTPNSHLQGQGCPECKKDNWECVSYAEGVNKQLCKATHPFECTPIIEQSAEVAFKKVLQFAGASFRRDAVDKRIVKETQKGKATYKGSINGRPGIIDSQNDVGGWPVYRSTEPYPDTNQDGIPDGWLEKNYPGKFATDINEEGYTYLEVYLNSLVEKITQSEYAGALSNKL